MSMNVVELKVTEFKKIGFAGLIFALGIIQGLSDITEEAVVRSCTSFYVQQLGLGFRSAIPEVRHSGGGPLGLTLTLTLTPGIWRTSGMADPRNGGPPEWGACTEL